MLAKNVDIVMGQIGESDLVLDIGGWVQPFRRADYVLDVLPFETRGVFGSLGNGRERFSRDTWTVHDVSSLQPLPFKTGQFDFVVCSHVLEDIRDPIRLCSEISRIGKRGYIEVPSRMAESTLGLEGEKYAGYCHHRWLVEIENSEIIFRFKPHLLHESWKFCFPSSRVHSLNEALCVSWCFWEGSIKCREIIQISRECMERELESYIRQFRVYPEYRYNIEKMWKNFRSPKQALRRMIMKHPWLRVVTERIIGKRLIESRGRNPWGNLPEIHSR